MQNIIVVKNLSSDIMLFDLNPSIGTEELCDPDMLAELFFVLLTPLSLSAYSFYDLVGNSFIHIIFPVSMTFPELCPCVTTKLLDLQIFVSTCLFGLSVWKFHSYTKFSLTKIVFNVPLVFCILLSCIFSQVVVQARIRSS